MLDSVVEQPFDSFKFREVLGHYPTGVVVVTAKVDESPIGMVVGSFTSVSLNPPLVAFLPDRSSSTYARLKNADRYVINVLSADQGELCRLMASRQVADKWANVRWTEAANGAPVLDDAIAWIECGHYRTDPAGDHDIVICQVENLHVGKPSLPLLFFQGYYGKFTSVTFASPVQPDLVGGILAGAVARPHLERLSAETGLECVVCCKVGDDLFECASSRQVDKGLPTSGFRIPNVPPFGAGFVAWADSETFDRWVAGLRRPIEEGERQSLLAGLDRVRERGWSIAIEGEEHPHILGGADLLARGAATPRQERDLLTRISTLIGLYEPATLHEAVSNRIRLISAPVRGRDGAVEMLAEIWGMPDGLTEAGLAGLAERLIQTAAAISSDLEAFHNSRKLP